MRVWCAISNQYWRRTLTKPARISDTSVGDSVLHTRPVRLAESEQYRSEIGVIRPSRLSCRLVFRSVPSHSAIQCKNCARPSNTQHCRSPLLPSDVCSLIWLIKLHTVSLIRLPIYRKTEQIRAFHEIETTKFIIGYTVCVYAQCALHIALSFLALLAMQKVHWGSRFASRKVGRLCMVRVSASTDSTDTASPGGVRTVCHA